MQILARQAYMSLPAFREMKLALDALGVSATDVIYGPPELRERYKTLVEDSRRLTAGIGFADMERELRRIRDVEFEFTRLRQSAQLFVMGLTKALSIALTGDENGLLKRLRAWNEWLITHIPELATKFSTYLVPILKDVWTIWQAIGDTVGIAVGMFSNFVNAISGDKIKPGTSALESFARAVDHIANAMATVAKYWDNTIGWVATHGFDQGRIVEIPGARASLPSNAIMAPPASPEVIAAVVNAARNAGVNPALALAIAQKESGLDPNAPRGAAGEYGMMQVMPGTFSKYGSGNPADFADNLNASMNYLSSLKQQYHGNEYAMASAYNKGTARAGDDYAADVMKREANFGNVYVNVQVATNASGQEIAQAISSELKKQSQRQQLQANPVFVTP
jgi:hypothetical protein